MSLASRATLLRAAIATGCLAACCRSSTAIAAAIFGTAATVARAATVTVSAGAFGVWATTSATALWRCCTTGFALTSRTPFTASAIAVSVAVSVSIAIAIAIAISRCRLEHHLCFHLERLHVVQHENHRQFYAWHRA